MGNGLSRVSPKCIPTPSDVDKSTLENYGITFVNKIDNGLMSFVEFPQDLGIVCERNRGDLWDGYIVQTDGSIIANISWTSKGSYDNYCSIKINDSDKKLDVSHYDFKNNLFILKLDPIQKLANKYNYIYDSEKRGHPQQNIDDAFKDFCDLRDKTDYKNVSVEVKNNFDNAKCPKSHHPSSGGNRDAYFSEGLASMASTQSIINYSGYRPQTIYYNN